MTAMQIKTADDGAAFVISQLANLEAKVYETKYRKIIYKELVPVDMSDPEWVDNIDYISYDGVAMGQFIGANGDDLPNVAMNARKDTIKVLYGGISYSYSLDELRKTTALNLPIDTTGANLSFRGFEEHAQRVCFSGDAARGVTGLFNNANVSLDESTVDYATATGAEIVADLNGILTEVWTNSTNVFLPDTLLIPSSIYSQISSQRMDSGTDTTVLEFFMLNNLFTSVTKQQLDVRPVLELATAGVNGVYRMVAYEKNQDNLVMKMPMSWRSVAPQPNGLKVEVPAEYKFGGVEFRYPTSAHYRDQYVE